MDLKVIRQFIEITDAGGFGKAADKIHLTQPALSKAIQQLELELGQSLLTRGKRGTAVSLTEIGEIVYRHGKQLLLNREQMLTELDDRKNLKQGVLKLGLAPLGSAELFAPVIAKFRTRYPQIEMQLMARGGVQQTQALQQGDIELATGIITLGQEFDGLKIRREPMVVALPAQHKLASIDKISLAMLTDVPHIMFSSEYALHKLVLQACINAGFTPTDVTWVSYPDFGLALVAAGGGVMLLPKLIAERHNVSGIVIKPLSDEALYWQLSLFWRANQPLSFAAQAMIEMVTQHLKKPYD